VPWDAQAFGFPVAMISRIEVGKNIKAAEQGYADFQAWLAAHGARIASCRLPHDRIADSMFLESRDFRFIEMVLHPQLDCSQQRSIPGGALAILPATAPDLPALEAIAEAAFHTERYHVDPRLDAALANRRYGRWVRGSLDHPAQRLLKVEADGQIVAAFIVEAGQGGQVYWHLTAIAPAFQGKGFGRRVWLSMLERHRNEGAALVTTTISARNVRVLNLYSKLAARFLPPQMTFHWVKPGT
jgi:GNAT superfamily N-acetyltransferase